MDNSQKAEKYIKQANERAIKGDITGAIDKYERALQIDPNNVVGWGNLGVMYEQLGKDAESEQAIKNAIAIAPDYAKGYYNLGMLMVKLKKPSLAADYLEQAVELMPEKVEYVFNQGVNLQRMGKISEQIKSFEKVAEINPDYPEIYYWLWLAYRRIARWEKLPGIELMLEVGVEHDPFINVVRSESLANNLQVAKYASSKLEVKKHFEHDKKSVKKLRIGYFSNDLREHPVGQMVSGMFGLHDRRWFEIVAIHTEVNDGSGYYTSIKKSVDEYIDLSDKKLSNEQIAQQIYNARIDILVEMTGHTKDNHLGVCAYRPAPIQIEWLGFPGTTGATFMDYVLGDGIVTPKEDQSYYTEKIVKLPHCYQVNTPLPTARKKYQRSEFGLPEKGFVFSSFNQIYKVDPVMWKVWMRILKRVTGSVLWLWGQHPECVKNLKAEAAKLGVDPERIIFSKSEKKAEHLARLKLSDLALDTRVYGGHTTTSDCLWAGVPVISRYGMHFASRVGSSILHEVGLDELVVASLEDYADLAVKLACDPAMLDILRRKLTHKELKKTLFNTKRFVTNLEKIFWQIWDNYLYA